MSMNIMIEGRRRVQVLTGKKTGKTSFQTVHWDCWQTPTTVTYKIKQSANPAQQYIDWVEQQGQQYYVAVYAADDIWGDGEPVGHKLVHDGQQHAQEFQEWICMCADEGYDVSYHVV